MTAPKHTPPELEVDGLYVIAVRGSTRQQVADCSVSAYGNSYVKLFGAAQKLRGASHMARDIIAMLDAEESIPVRRITEALEALDAALAAAEGRTEEKEG